MDYMENHISAAEMIIGSWENYGMKNKTEILKWMTAFLYVLHINFYQMLKKKFFNNRLDSLYQLLGNANELLKPEKKFEGKNTIMRYVRILLRDIQKYGSCGGVENLIYKMFFRS